MTRASILVIALFLHFACSRDLRDERGWRTGRQRLQGIELPAGASTLAWDATTATLYVADDVQLVAWDGERFRPVVATRPTTLGFAAYDAGHQRLFVIERDHLHVVTLTSFE